MKRLSVFQNRAWMHDSIAAPTVAELFQIAGFSEFNIGIETTHQALNSDLKKRRDPIALRLRFRPDKVLMHKSIPETIVCEIKCEYSGRPNFAIEYDSYVQGKQWGVDGTVVYAFVDITGIEDFYAVDTRFCMGDDMPAPTKVYLPDRVGHKQFESRIQQDLPTAEIKITNHSGGSGTPYILISKGAPYLQTPEDFFFGSN